MAVAARAGLVELADRHLTVPRGPGHAAGLKVSALVGGMVAGADSIADMAVLRQGGMGRLFTGVRAPTTLGTFLRSLKFGHVRQLDAVAARFLTGLAGQMRLLDRDAAVTYVDIDDTIRRTYGYAKQGSGYGYSGVKGLNALLGIAATAGSAPVIVATRLRKGSANSARGAARLVADSLQTTRACRAGGTVILRADSAYYNRDIISAARRGGARFSITARKDRAVMAAIAAIHDDAWITIKYPNAVFDQELNQWVSDAQVAETPFTAFASRGKTGQVPARLIVRRVKDAKPNHVVAGEQGELFPVWRHHAVFADSPLPMLTAEADHRRHAIIEQVIADLKNGPLAHLPSNQFTANSGWLVLAAMAFNLNRAVGVAAGGRHTTAVTATIGTHLISVAGRIVRSARRTTLRLPNNWPWTHGFQKLLTAVGIGPPPTA